MQQETQPWPISSPCFASDKLISRLVEAMCGNVDLLGVPLFSAPFDVFQFMPNCVHFFKFVSTCVHLGKFVSIALETNLESKECERRSLFENVSIRTKDGGLF